MIIINNVSYGKSNQILNNIDLKITPGELVFLIGAPGSGKTAFLSLLTGLDKPTHGQINVNGRALSAISYRGLILARREMGIILDKFDLFPELTLNENIEIPLMVKKIDKKERDKLALQIVNEIGIHQKRHFLVKELSSQENKVGAIARALVTEPNIIIADDIFDILEHVWHEKIIAKINELQNKGSLVIISTRSQSTELLNKFHSRKRIITLSQGKIIQDEIIGKEKEL